ncbi:hypothetical protein Tco_1170207, partial [Tanacetum coccineum]
VLTLGSCAYVINFRASAHIQQFLSAWSLFCDCNCADTMADAEHAPAMAPPVRTDEQILLRIRWVPIGKSNCYLNEEKSQPSPIYRIAMDILKQTNLFRAFTVSLNLLSRTRKLGHSTMELRSLIS